jgi:hypothetical protein
MSCPKRAPVSAELRNRKRSFRVFRGDGRRPPDPDRPSLDWTVREFVDRFVMPKYLRAKGTSKETILLLPRKPQFR